MLAASSGRRRAQEQSAAAAGRRNRRGDPVPAMAARQQFHLPRRARLQAVDGHALEPDFDARSASCARARCACSGAAASCSNTRRKSWRSCKEPRPLIVAKANVQLAGASPRLSRLYRRQALRRRRQPDRRIPHRRAVHLDRLYAHRAQHSLSAPQDRRRRSARRLRSAAAIPARRSPTCWSTIRATSCSRSTRTRFTISRWRSCSSTSVRACACWRGATASTVSSRCWCSCRASATTAHIRVKRSASISPSAFIGRVSAFYPFFPEGPLVRVHFIIGRSGGATPDVDRATLESAVADIVRTWTDGFAGGAGCWSTRRPRRDGLFARYRDAFSAGFREAYSPAIAAGDIRVIEGLRRAAARRRFPSPAEEEQQSRRPQGLELRPPAAAVGARAGAGKHGLPRGRRAHLSDRADRRRRSRSLVPRHAAGAPRRRRRSISTTPRRSSKPRS